MKKFISAFLSVVMLLSITMGMNLSVFADDGNKTIVSASLTPIKPYTIYEGAYSYYDKGVGYYWAPDFNAGDIINITFSDKTKATYTYYNQYEYTGWYTSNNDEISVVGYSFCADKLGETYVSYCIDDFGFDIKNVPVTIVNNPVDSFSFVPINPYEIMEKTNGYYDEDDSKWYYVPDFNIGDKIIINYTNGTSEEYTYKKNRAVEFGYSCDFVNTKNEILKVVRINFSFEGTGNTTFIVELPDYGKTSSVPVSIVENPIASISFDPVEPYEIYENSHGSYDDENNWEYYAPEFNDGDKITLNYKNGTSEEFVYKRGNIWNFVNTEDKMLNSYSNGFSFEGIGSTTFELGLLDYNKSINIPVKIIENPIDSFTFTPIKEYEVIENSGEVDGEDCYYDAPDFNDGDKISIKYTNGTSDEFIYVKGSGDFINDKNEVLYVIGYVFCYTGSGKTTFEVKLTDYEKIQQVPVTIVKKSSGGSTDPTPIPGGGSTGGGGAAPAPAPTTDDSQKTEEQKPSTSITTTTTTSAQTPATVKVSKTTAKKKGVVVTWKKVKNVTGYEIQLATDKKFKKNKKTVKVNKQNASKKTVKKLKSKKKYYVRVRTYKVVNGKKVYSKWSKVKSVKTK